MTEEERLTRERLIARARRYHAGILPDVIWIEATPSRLSGRVVGEGLEDRPVMVARDATAPSFDSDHGARPADAS